MLTLYTVGHGNRPLEELIALLKGAGVTTLVDVRAQPRSRHNPQFNDDSLRAACERAGLTYHWAGRQLGGMREPRADSPHVALDEGRRGFADHMDTEAFRKGAAQLRNLAAGSRGDSATPSRGEALSDGGSGAALPERCSLSRRLPAPKAFVSGAGSPFGDGGSGAHGNMAHGGHLRPLPKEHSPRALGATAQSACAILCAERDPAHCHRALIADFLTLQGVRVAHLLAPGETREHVLSPEARRESAALVYDRQVTGRLDL